MTISELRGFQSKLKNGGRFTGIVRFLKQQDESGSSYNLLGMRQFQRLEDFKGRKEGSCELHSFTNLSIQHRFHV
jgi:hypothetical protein